MNTPHEVTGPINLGNPAEFTMLGAGPEGARRDRRHAAS